MPRYFKLGASKGADRDTCLFQDHQHHQHAAHGQQQHGAGKWAPSLRRAQSSRERPVVAPPPLQQEQYRRGSRFDEQEEEDDDEGDEMEDHQDRRRRKSVSSPPGAAGFLRRAMSSREQHHQFHQQQQRPDLWSRRDGELLGPLEAAVQRGFAPKKPPSGLEQQSPAAKQVSRAQSMRYNRIVSSNDDNDEQLTPPRHSSFAGYGRHQGPPPRSCSSAKNANKKRVVVSASYQTGEGEILSIECAKCGRWLGTVAHSVNLDEGMIKLCQICHPPTSEQQQQPSETTVASKKGSSFVRGIRRMLGLKKRQGAAAAPLGSASPPPMYNKW